MKYLIVFIVTLVHLNSFGNMASPYDDGTKNYPAVTSAQIDILKEILTIRLLSDFSSAQYTAEYFVHCENAAEQIPLLFIAENFKDNFKVFVDDVPVELLEFEADQFKKFPDLDNNLDLTLKNVFGQGSFSSSFSNLQYNPRRDFKFFHVNLTRGNHTIRAEYLGMAHINRRDWVKNYTFSYILEPAKHWKSFGELEVKIIHSSDRIEYTTNLGEKTFQPNDSTQIWQFNVIPADYLRIDFTPKTNIPAAILIFLGPFGITLIFFLSILWLHIKTIHQYRAKNHHKIYSPALIIGNLLIPLATSVFFCFAYTIIDYSIGDAASEYHGYFVIGVLLFLPILQIIYSFSLWAYDKILKKKYAGALPIEVG